ncbi:unnamed protein product [Lampetra planeri]
MARGASVWECRREENWNDLILVEEQLSYPPPSSSLAFSKCGGGASWFSFLTRSLPPERLMSSGAALCPGLASAQPATCAPLRRVQRTRPRSGRTAGGWDGRTRERNSSRTKLAAALPVPLRKANIPRHLVGASRSTPSDSEVHGGSV